MRRQVERKRSVETQNFPQFFGNDTHFFELLEYFDTIKKEIDTKNHYIVSIEVCYSSDENAVFDYIEYIRSWHDVVVDVALSHVKCIKDDL